MKEHNKSEREEIYSTRLRAGKRTYFFDVKSTRDRDYYLTITESKKKFNDNGYSYDKHKIFLYKEDFNKFVGALEETVNYIKKELMPDYDFTKFDRPASENSILDSGTDKGDKESEQAFHL